MSYDVSIGDRDFNMTWNVGKLFYDHIPDAGNGGGLNEINGKTGRAACQIIGDAFERIDRTRHELWDSGSVGEPKFCDRYDALNGWGSAVGGLVFLAMILSACADNPRKRVRVS